MSAVVMHEESRGNQPRKGSRKQWHTPWPLKTERIGRGPSQSTGDSGAWAWYSLIALSVGGKVGLGGWEDKQLFIAGAWNVEQGVDRDAPGRTIFTCDTDKNYFLMEEGVWGCVDESHIVIKSFWVPFQPCSETVHFLWSGCQVEPRALCLCR